MKFRDLILSKFDKSDIGAIPRGFKRIGNKIILRSQYDLTAELGEAILSSYPWCTGVFQHQTTKGESRIPSLKYLAGSKNTIVKHHENGVTYKLDIACITFSGGNRSLRTKLVAEVSSNDILLDMFAAVGNLSLQVILKRGIQAKLIEKNKNTYNFLLQTLELNNIDPSIAINMDCRNFKTENFATRIFMGYHNVDETHIKTAIKAAKSHCFLHLHPLAKPKYNIEWIEKYQYWIESYQASVVSYKTNKIKNYSPGLNHIEIIFEIKK